MNLLQLAELQLNKEGRGEGDDNFKIDLLDRALAIRKWIDKHKAITEKILIRRKVYQYGNRFVFSNK